MAMNKINYLDMKKKVFLSFLIVFGSFFVTGIALSQNPSVWTVETVPNTKLSSSLVYVSDPDNLLDETSKAEINSILGQAESNSSAEVFVVALKSIGDVYIKDFATSLFNTWNIGKKSKDNGLLILMVEDVGKISFETGYGMEGVFPDAICMRIINNDIIPIMKEGNYGLGILNGVKAVKKIIDDPNVAAEIAQDMEAEKAAVQEAKMQQIKNIVFGYLAISIIVLIFSLISVGKKKFNIETVKVSKPAEASGSVEIEKETEKEKNITKVTGGKVAARTSAPYEAYKTMASGKMGYNVLAIIFPLTMVFFLVWYSSKMRKLRKMPRACASCAKPMQRMNESQEDAYLSTGQQSEELVGSVDYDAWVCMDCGQREVVSYGKEFTKYKSCPKCGYKTYALERDRILLAPTPISNGQGEKIYSCSHCQNEVRKSYIIPMIILASAGRGRGGFGGGGGGFGGGGFGGGFSGGGGATGGWK